MDDKIDCNLYGLKIIGKGDNGTVYDLKNGTVVKKINITKQNIKRVKWEIKIMRKISSNQYFPTLYKIKLCSDNNNPYMLIKMEKFDESLKEWMKSGKIYLNKFLQLLMY